MHQIDGSPIPGPLLHNGLRICWLFTTFDAGFRSPVGPQMFWKDWRQSSQYKVHKFSRRPSASIFERCRGCPESQVCISNFVFIGGLQNDYQVWSKSLPYNINRRVNSPFRGPRNWWPIYWVNAQLQCLLVFYFRNRGFPIHLPVLIRNWRSHIKRSSKMGMFGKAHAFNSFQWHEGILQLFSLPLPRHTSGFYHALVRIVGYTHRIGLDSI